MARDRQMRLGAFLMGVGHHVSAWLHPSVDPRALTELRHYVHLAQVAERAKFDAIFFADNVAMFGGPSEIGALAAPIYYYEPLSLLAAIAPQTERIGLVATVSATYLPPYHLARKFASIDHLSGGRAGWNCVTSGSDAEAHNFGLDHQPEHAHRYARAGEYVEVVKTLWNSWEEGALIADREARRYYDPTRVHPIDHEGRFFKVAGPLQLDRTPQGHPVIVQAGSSDDGVALAATTAERVFTAQQSRDDAIAFRQRLRDATAANGRDPDEILVLPGIMPFVAETREAAQRYHDELQELVDPRIGIGLVSGLMGVDLSQHPLDGPLPEPASTEGWQSRQKLFVDTARAEGLTIRQLIARVVTARGHKTIIGTPTDIADLLEDWFAAGAADGFNIMGPTLPQGLEAFAELVVPELQRRDLFRTEYAGRTLRDHLGLAIPRTPALAAAAE
ncbi:LLM class flavin-dependent oxidoreductase [Sphingomonas sp. dw_22]|uniref:LLM class flavin-dependent oxidoreductase n=1 Tax=Sphingomonas sp. dw_22 TaxID=2721175 RepID=UPI001BD5647D|nr:LLM class flavin-dependent oxidoreductase [Sphingomonas sp. dw_22]